MIRWIPLLLVPALGACAGNRYCLAEQEYQRASVVPDLQPVDGLQLPQSPSALKLPPAPASTVAFGHKDQAGDGVCLDKPPRMSVPASPAPAKPAQKAS